MKRFSRRAFLAGSGAATGLLLRSLATGLPPGFLLRPRASRAQNAARPQVLILATSSRGDPVNVNCPGSYLGEGQGAENNHRLPISEVELGGMRVRGADAWQQLDGDLRARLAFFHCQTRSAAHPEYASTMSFHGSVKNRAGNGSEMFASMLAELAEPLGTLQSEPLPLCDEVITIGGQPLQNLKPSEIRALFSSQDGLANLGGLRDETLDALWAPLRRDDARRAERAFVDRYARSREQADELATRLSDSLNALSGDDSVTDQIIAAVAMAQFGVAPVITIKIPFGGDNHRDSDLSIEAAETLSGIAAIGDLWSRLVAAGDGLHNKVTFAMLNVFGRELRRNVGGGRNHNRQHATMVAFGAGISPGVYGGVGPVGDQHGALSIDSVTGQGRANGNIPANETLEAAGKSLARAMGHGQAEIDARIRGGRIVESFLAQR